MKQSFVMVKFILGPVIEGTEMSAENVRNTLQTVDLNMLDIVPWTYGVEDHRSGVIEKLVDLRESVVLFNRGDQQEVGVKI